MESKEIKVYGTLVNETVGTVTDASHNDILMNAYLLYDGRFINNGGVNNYQDVINKRVTAITYADGVTTIAGDLIVTGNINGLNFVRNLSDLQDVDTTGIGSNKYLKYNGTKWVPASITISDINNGISLNDLSDVNTAGAANGSILKYNGTSWVVGTDNSVTTLNGLTDVTISSASNNQLLSYNGSQWVNKTVGINDLNMPSAQDGLVLKYRNGSWVAANDEQGGSGGETAPEGYEYVYLTVTRVYNKVGQVSNTAFMSSALARTEGFNSHAFSMSRNGIMNTFVNSVRNITHFYLYTPSNENIPADALIVSNYWINIPDNLYVYMYKNNNILQLIAGQSSSNDPLGLPDFSSASVREGRAVYYSSKSNAMVGYVWQGSNTRYLENVSSNARLYYNGCGSLLPGFMLSTGADSDFASYDFSIINGNSVVHYNWRDSYTSGQAMSTTTISGGDVNSSITKAQVKAAGLVSGIPEITPNAHLTGLFVADDITMPSTISNVITYKYLRPIL